MIRKQLAGLGCACALLAPAVQAQTGAPPAPAPAPAAVAPSPAPEPPSAAAPAPAPTGPSFDLDIRAPDTVRPVLERHLELQRYREVNDLDDAEIARLIVLAERDARQLLGTLGYFAPEIRITRETSGNRPRIVVQVEPGTQARVAEVDISFEGDIATTTDREAVAQRGAIESGWQLPAGQGFTQDAWTAAKADALRDLTSRRYLAGRVADSLADVDAATSRVGLGLKLNSGPVYRLGPMAITGAQRYEEVLVPRLARLSPGMVYDREQLVQAQLRLTGSGYYDSAFIFVDPDSAPEAAEVQVTVREARLQRLVLGVGFTTDAGPRLTVEHTHNRMPWIGWRAASKIQLDRKQPLVQTEWTSIPAEDGWRWSTLAGAERVDDNGLLTFGQRLRFGRFRNEDHIDRNVYVQYDRASVKPAGTVPVDPSEIGDGSALSVNYVWTGRYFDNNTSPTAGRGYGFELGAGITLGGDRAPFQRTVVRWMGFHPLTTGRIRLRAEAGAVISRSDARLPATQLFRTGGDTTVRGYGYREIGVPLSANRIGPGRYLASGSVEWQRPIRRNGVVSDFESLLFVDAGAVADRPGELRPWVGAGTGVRWRSPLGPVDAALAYGFKTNKPRVHLAVGFVF